MEQQGSTYQDQLVKRNQMIGDIEANLRSVQLFSLLSDIEGGSHTTLLF